MKANIFSQASLVMCCAGVLLMAGCNGPSPCGESVVQSAISSDGATAKVVVVNCGATTDFITLVNLETSRVKIRDAGLLFGYKGKADVQVQWSGERALKIVCLECERDRVYRAVQKEEQYEITYSLGRSS
jgi:hypothetical protein